MDVTFSDWRVEDHLKTMKARKAYIRAAAEEGSLASVFDAFADVFRSMGKPVEAMACDGLAASLSARGAVRPRRTAKRELAMA